MTSGSGSPVQRINFARAVAISATRSLRRSASSALSRCGSIASPGRALPLASRAGAVVARSFRRRSSRSRIARRCSAKYRSIHAIPALIRTRRRSAEASASAMPISAVARAARAWRLAMLGTSWLMPTTPIVKLSLLNLPASGPVKGKSWSFTSSLGSGSRSAAIAEDRAASTCAARAAMLGASASARASACSKVSGPATAGVAKNTMLENAR